MLALDSRFSDVLAAEALLLVRNRESGGLVNVGAHLLQWLRTAQRCTTLVVINYDWHVLVDIAVWVPLFICLSLCYTIAPRKWLVGLLAIWVLNRRVGVICLI